MERGTRFESGLGRRFQHGSVGSAIVKGQNVRRIPNPAYPRGRQQLNVSSGIEEDDALSTQISKNDRGNQKKEEETKYSSWKPVNLSVENRRSTFSDLESLQKQRVGLRRNNSGIFDKEQSLTIGDGGLNRMTLSEGLRQSSLEIQTLHHEMHSLRTTVDTKEDEMSTLKNEVKTYEAKLEQTRHELNVQTRKAAQVDRFKESLEKAQAAEKQAKSLLEISQQQLQHAKNQAQLKGSRLKDAEEADRQRQEEINQLREQLKQEQILNEQVTQQLHDEKRQSRPGVPATNVEDLQQNLDTEREKTVALSRQLSEERERALSLAGQLKKVKEKLQDTVESHITFEKNTEVEIDQLRTLVAEHELALSKQLKLAKGTELKLEAEVASLQKEIDKSNQKKDLAEKQFAELKDKYKTLENMESTITLLTTQVANFKQSYYNASNKSQNLQSQVEVMANDKAELSRRLELSIANEKSATKELASLKAQAIDRASRLEILEKEAQVISQEKDSMENEKNSLLAELQTLQVSHTKNLKCLAELSTERSELQEKVEETTITYEKLLKELQEARTSIEITSQRLSQIQVEKERLYQKANSAVNERDELSRLNNNMKAQIHLLQQTIASKDSELTTVESVRSNTIEAKEKAEAKFENAVAELEQTKRSMATRMIHTDELEAKIKDLENELAIASKLKNGISQQDHINEIANLRAELDTEIIKWRSRAGSLEAEVAHAKKQLLEQQESIQQRLKSLEAKAALSDTFKTLLNTLREETQAQRAIQNLRLLLRSAETTDATTYLEFARIKEKSLEQHLQVLVYNVTACESHMIQCEPTATKKQQKTRQDRLQKLEEQLRESEKQRDDYLDSSKTNKLRLEQLMTEAQAKLASIQAASKHLLSTHLPGFRW